MIEFDCPHCGKALKLDDTMAGKPGTCPSCQQVIQVPGTAQSANAPAPPVPAAQAAAATPGNGLSIASLVLGIVAIATMCFAPVSILLGLLAVIFGIIGIVVRRNAQASAALPVAGLVLGGVGMLLPIVLVGAVVIPGLSGAQKKAREVASLANLRTIGNAMAMYEQEHDRFPADLQAMIDERSIDERTLKYPRLKSGRFSDYFYLAPGPDAPAESLVACEYADCGSDKTRGFLRADGSVERLPEADFLALEREGDHNRAFFRALRRAE